MSKTYKIRKSNKTSTTGKTGTTVKDLVLLCCSIPEEFAQVVLGAPELDLKSVRPPKADIQNKANKTCSVCEVKSCPLSLPLTSSVQVTFDIRKSFIEHCQLVS